MDISCFLNHLARYSGENTFNPWADHDENYEIEKALAIRRANLKDYLTLRIGGARILLVAEACGYQGGHFSGIAMTCERMLLDFHPAVTSAMAPRRSAKCRPHRFHQSGWTFAQKSGFCSCPAFCVWRHIHLIANFFTFFLCFGLDKSYSVFHNRQLLPRITLSTTATRNCSKFKSS